MHLANAQQGIELMVIEHKHQSNMIFAQELDFLSWNWGQQPLNKHAKPRHRARTLFHFAQLLDITCTILS